MKYCKIVDCGKKHYAKGYCQYHYQAIIQKDYYRKYYSKNREKYREIRRRYYVKNYIKKGGTGGEHNGNWNGGTAEYKNHHVMKKNRIIKFEQTRGKCEVCGNPAKHIHHKDKTKTNHSLENLTAVCIPCHFDLHAGEMGRHRKYGKYSLVEMGQHANLSTREVWKYFNNKKVSEKTKNKIKGLTYEM